MTDSSPAGGLLKAAAIVVILFGLLTVLVGGLVLFGGSVAAEMAGEAVPFVLWFNFLAGFAYVAVGIGLLNRRSWAVWLSALVASLTGLAFIAFGVHVSLGGSFETRTFGAMAFRLILWFIITYVAATQIGWRSR